MGLYGFFICHDCCQTLVLGKAYRSSGRPVFFHAGAMNPPNWNQPELNQVLWKFLADHCGHRINVRLDEDMTEEELGFPSIGGDSLAEPSREKYLSGWSGLDCRSDSSG